MLALKIGKENFKNEVLKSEKPVHVDFFAPWCGPCRMLSPIVEEIAAERDDVKVVKVNVDDEPELAAAFSVVSIPSLFVVRNGKIAKQSVGALPKAKILAMLDEA